MWREKKEQHKTSSVKHGAGSVMAWTYKAASGTDTLTFIDNFTADRSNRVNIEQYRCIVRFKTHFKTYFCRTMIILKGRLVKRQGCCVCLEFVSIFYIVDQ